MATNIPRQPAPLTSQSPPTIPLPLALAQPSPPPWFKCLRCCTGRATYDDATQKRTGSILPPLSPPRAMVPLSETACVFTPPSATYLRPPAHLTAATPWSSLSACDLPCPAGPCLVPCSVPGPGCLVALLRLVSLLVVGAKRGVGPGVVHFVLSRPCCFVHFEYTLNPSYKPPPWSNPTPSQLPTP